MSMFWFIFKFTYHNRQKQPDWFLQTSGACQATYIFGTKVNYSATAKSAVTLQ